MPLGSLFSHFDQITQNMFVMKRLFQIYFGITGIHLVLIKIQNAQIFTAQQRSRYNIEVMSKKHNLIKKKKFNNVSPRKTSKSIEKLLVFLIGKIRAGPQLE